MCGAQLIAPEQHATAKRLCPDIVGQSPKGGAKDEDGVMILEDDDAFDDIEADYWVGVEEVRKEVVGPHSQQRAYPARPYEPMYGSFGYGHGSGGSSGAGGSAYSRDKRDSRDYGHSSGGSSSSSRRSRGSDTKYK